ncbi:hypothetical protein [Tenacibaculum agarivorans]|uniref:hypothetical protein n=1 Tax=Tenacibaculum agarivorans TaxID=1908389 RepID=UPI00094BBB56|nr:hypothetical protein [Tenacibaculum agarivorans]
MFFIFQRKKEVKDEKLALQEDKRKLQDQIEKLKKDKEKETQLKYAEKFDDVILAVSKFVNGYTTPKTIIVNLDELLNKMSSIFRELKGVDCCFTVKIIKQGEKIETLCRTDSKNKRYNREDFQRYHSDFEDFLNNNTDLFSIFGKQKHENIKGRYVRFFSNNLPLEQNYKHSHLEKTDYHNNVKKLVDDHGYSIEEASNKLWNLPYKSTIVIPIGLMEKKHNDPDFQYIGTICVDSEEKNVFNKGTDISILQSIAETIYVTFRASNKKVKSADSKI